MPDEIELAMKKEISRRQFLKRAIAFGLAVPSAGALLAACSSSSSTTSITPAPAASGVATATPGAGTPAPSAVAATSANLFDTMPTATQK